MYSSAHLHPANPIEFTMRRQTLRACWGKLLPIEYPAASLLGRSKRIEPGVFGVGPFLTLGCFDGRKWSASVAMVRSDGHLDYTVALVYPVDIHHMELMIATTTANT
jgi:hypothetical protein